MGLVVGIALGKMNAKASLGQRRRLGISKKPKEIEVEGEAELWSEGNSAMPQIFKALARSLPESARRPDCSANISIPDPLVRQETVVFKDFPSGEKEGAELAKWRFARDHQLDADKLACSFQRLSQSGNDAVVLVRVCDRLTVEEVRESAASAGFFPNRLDGFSGYLPGELGSETGGLLWADEQSWFLRCWNTKSGSHIMESGWADESQSPQARITRIAKAFAIGTGEKAVHIQVNATPIMLESVLAQNDFSAPVKFEKVAEPSPQASFWVAAAS